MGKAKRVHWILDLGAVAKGGADVAKGGAMGLINIDERATQAVGAVLAGMHEAQHVGRLGLHVTPASPGAHVHEQGSVRGILDERAPSRLAQHPRTNLAAVRKVKVMLRVDLHALDSASALVQGGQEMAAVGQLRTVCTGLANFPRRGYRCIVNETLRMQARCVRLYNSARRAVNAGMTFLVLMQRVNHMLAAEPPLADLHVSEVKAKLQQADTDRAVAGL